MRHRSSLHGDNGLRTLIRKNYLKLFLAICLSGVIIVYLEMFKLSASMTQSIDQTNLNERHQQFGNYDGEEGNPSIAVLLTHYRDAEECARTIISLYSNAVHANSLSVYLFEEVELHDEFVDPSISTCIQHLCKLSSDVCSKHLSNRIRHKRRHHGEHVGPSQARSIVENMLPTAHGHKFYLSITTRLDFQPLWDRNLVSQWTSIANPKAILSTMPPAFRTKNWPQELSYQAIMCTGHITSRRANVALVAFNPPVLVKEPRNKAPRLTSQYSEDFHFGPIDALNAAPSDPKVEFVWAGIEFYRATRWWTRGYDFYSPTNDVVYEKYTPRHKHPLQGSPWSETVRSMKKELSRQKDSLFHIRRVLQFNMGEPPSREDLSFTQGDARTMEQWIEFSAINPAAEYDVSTDKQFQNCHPLELVPTK